VFGSIRKNYAILRMAATATCGFAMFLTVCKAGLRFPDPARCPQFFAIFDKMGQNRKILSIMAILTPI
jgi:hypothetical protein